MTRMLLAVLMAGALVAPAGALTIHRSFRNGYPAGAQGVAGATCTTGVKLSVKRSAGAFSKFRNRTWVTGVGKVVQILDRDDKEPGYQRFVVADASGDTVLIVNDVVESDWLPDLNEGEVIAFKGEYLANGKNGGYVHRTHPDKTPGKPGGWVKRAKVVKRTSTQKATTVDATGTFGR